MKINDHSTPTSGAIELTVHIDAQRAMLLWSVAAGTTAMDWDGRFEVAGGGDFLDGNDVQWNGGSLMWCESVLEAFVLTDYEAACGYRSTLLWDLAAEQMGGLGHVVLSSRALS